MRLLLACAALVAIVASACGGSDDDSTPTARPPATAAGSSPVVPGITPIPTPVGGVPTTPPNTPQSGASIEVTGVVGSVNVSAGIIEIKRTQGANVTRISFNASTAIRKAGGGSARPADIRISDRIIASGALDGGGDVLVATEITVQDVIPGSAPGG